MSRFSRIWGKINFYFNFYIFIYLIYNNYYYTHFFIQILKKKIIKKQYYTQNVYVSLLLYVRNIVDLNKITCMTWNILKLQRNVSYKLCIKCRWNVNRLYYSNNWYKTSSIHLINIEMQCSVWNLNFTSQRQKKLGNIKCLLGCSYNYLFNYDIYCDAYIYHDGMSIANC